MPPQRASTAQPGSEAKLAALIDALATSDALLAGSSLDSLVERVRASGSPALCSRLVLTLHGRGELRRARSFADSCAERFPEDKGLARVRRLVAPPRILVGPPVGRVDRRRDLEWLAAHSLEYPGEWLVLSGGRLWGHSPSLSEAKEQAQAAGLAERPLLHRVHQV